METENRTPAGKVEMTAMAALDGAQELFQRQLDGDLDVAETAALARLLEGSAQLRAEHRQWQRLGEDLGASRISVRPGFATEVLAALPEPEARAVAAAVTQASRRAWLAPLVLVAAFGTLAVTLGGLGSGSSSVFTVFGSVGDLIVAVLVAGSGLLGASWQGLRLAVGDAFAASPAASVGVALLLLGLNVLLYRALRRRPAKARASRRRD